MLAIVVVIVVVAAAAVCYFFTWIIATFFGKWFIANLLRPDLSNASTLLRD